MSDKNPKAIIASSGDGYTFTLAPEASQLKADALSQAGEILVVEDEDGKNLAIKVAALLKGISKRADKAREELKAPVLVAGRAIDALHKDYAAELDAECKRLEKLAAIYIQEQAKAAEEQRRKEREAQAALERQQQEAEQALEKALSTGRTEDFHEAARAHEAVKVRAAAQPSPQPIAVPSEVDGASVRSAKPVIKVIDLAALYRAYPHAVELTARMSVLNDLVACGNHKIPGVEVTFETTLTVKGAKLQ